MTALIIFILSLGAPILIPTESDGTTLPASVTATQTRQTNSQSGLETLWTLRFTLESAPKATTVALAGSFNHWSRSRTPMQQADDGIWSASISLPDGTHWYKFVVDDTRWITDSRNPDTEPDGYGGRNSVLRLGPEANLDGDGGVVGDGRINPVGLAHHPQKPLFRQPSGNAAWRIRFRTLRNDVEQVSLSRGDDPARVEPLHRVVQDDRFQFWETITPAPSTPITYRFIIQDGDRIEHHDRTYTMTDVDLNSFTTPDWVRDAIWYQIMVDRFRNGTPENDPEPVRPWTARWYEPSDWEGVDGQTFYRFYVFSRLYGGDLQGLASRLDYLRDLGVNALYLNPIFQSKSHHKYDTTNYLHVDESFGQGRDYDAAEAREDLLDATTWTFTDSDRVFLDFLKAAKAAGFRVIIDGVFNHVGVRHPAFQDVLKNGKDSRFADWFEVTSWDPFEYEGWAGFKSLPAFRKDEEHGIASASARAHLMQVTRRWLDPDGDGDPSDGIDGWRLDVPNEVPRAFWVEWRTLVKSINPDAYIVGEIWDRADTWLDGTTFDAVMNYPFAEATLNWIGDRENKISATELDRRLSQLRMAYPDAATNALQNLLDSHDTDRLVSKIHNPDRPFDEGNREQDDDTYDGDKPPESAYAAARLAVLLQMTWLSPPMIYYGDEVGIWGSDDPNNRKPMLWDDLEPYEDPEYRIMPDHLDFYRRAVALRKGSAALRRGDVKTVHLDDEQDTFAFLRTIDGEEMLIVLNASAQEVIVDLPRVGAGWSRVFSQPPDTETGNPPRMTIPPLGGVVWRRTS